MIKLFLSNKEDFKYEAIYYVNGDNYLQSKNLMYFHYNNIFIYYNFKEELITAVNNGINLDITKPDFETKRYLSEIHSELLRWIKDYSYECLVFENINFLIEKIKKDNQLKEIHNLNYIVSKEEIFIKIGVDKL
ncbi:MAG: hypothetical protein K2M08_03145 [Anaeroplasmataceae bacterium]|nr:hypothetical protein [Anaeroplasmataceae bacterium]